jgi:CRP-like cAMP-binding protein
MAAPLAMFLAKNALAPSDRAAVIAADWSLHTLAKGECIQDQGAMPEGLFLLSSGVAQATRALPDGRQQILSLFVPANVVNCTPLPGPSRMRICALTPVTVLQISHEALEPLVQQHPGILMALWRETALHAVIQQEWIVSMGCQSSYARLARFIGELSFRFQAAGLGTAENVEFPLNQSDIADVLGISVVHVNRVLQRLRKDGLVSLSRNRLAILDRHALYQVAEFDPEYLRLPISDF